MKNYLLSFALALLVANSFAQKVKDKPLSISIGVETVVPVTFFNDVNSFGLGASLLAEYRISKKFSATLNAGYVNYFGKTVDGYKYPSRRQISLLTGARYYFIKDVYVLGELGVSYFKPLYGGTLSYATGIGTKFKKLDLSLKYMGNKFNGPTFSNVSLRVAIKL